MNAAVFVVRAAWVGSVGLGLVVMGYGLEKTVYFEPTGEALAEARTGEALIFVASLMLVAAAAWSQRWSPIWVAVTVVAPAVLCGGLTLVAAETLFPHLSVLVAYPLALIGTGSGILGRQFVVSR